MQSKPHYGILDALRGVAAIAVVCYHLFEAIAFSAGDPEQKMFHGFLAVDFFFILSGFVMGYAYDNRWGSMSLGGFIRRRLIRLHPMVVMGVVIGLVAFVSQGSLRWDGTHVDLSTVLWCALLGLFLIPSFGHLDVRGNTEMFPLNGPHWSLFFEYIGSLIYGLFLHRLSTRALGCWVFVALALLLGNALQMGEGHIAYGWSSEPLNIWGGFLRLSFGYPMGLLLARLFQRAQPAPMGKAIFPLCSLAVLALLCIPNLKNFSLYYQILCVGVFFPTIIWLGARGVVEGQVKRTASLLGRISYPLYAIHYPLIYMYIRWLNDGVTPFGMSAWCTPVAIFCTAVIAAYFIMRYYDEPLREWLSRK